MIDDTNLKTDSEYNNETDSANNPVRKKELDDTTSTSKKNKRFITVVIVIAVIIGLFSPFIIDITSPSKKSEITADGLLEYIVSLISAAVTALLALYAIYQTNQANEMTERANKATVDADKRAYELTKQANLIAEKALEIERINYQLHIRPFITVTEYCADMISKNSILTDPQALYICIGESGRVDDYNPLHNIDCIKLKITNTTESFLTFQYLDGETDDSDIGLDYSVEGIKNLQKRRVPLNAGDSATIVLYSEDKIIRDLENKEIHLNFKLENKTMKKYIESFSVYFTWISIHDNKLSCVLEFRDYNMLRYEHRDGKTILIKEEL